MKKKYWYIGLTKICASMCKWCLTIHPFPATSSGTHSFEIQGSSSAISIYRRASMAVVSSSIVQLLIKWCSAKVAGAISTSEQLVYIMYIVIPWNSFGIYIAIGMIDEMRRPLRVCPYCVIDRYRAWFGAPLQIAKFMGPTWYPSGACRPQMGSMLAPWTLLSGTGNHHEQLDTDLVHFGWTSQLRDAPFQGVEYKRISIRHVKN